MPRTGSATSYLKDDAKEEVRRKEQGHAASHGWLLYSLLCSIALLHPAPLQYPTTVETSHLGLCHQQYHCHNALAAYLMTTTMVASL